MTDEILPRPDGASTWTLCPDFVSQVTREIRQTEGWHIDMEGAEMAMLAAERYIIDALNQRASVQEAAVSQNDLYYLRAISRRLDEFQSAMDGLDALTIGGEALADERDWLDCFIDQRASAIAEKGGE